MRFQLNLAAVVRNVADLANVANLAVVRFVASYLPEHHAISGSTHGIVEMREYLCIGSCQLDRCGNLRGCVTRLGSLLGLTATPNLALAFITPPSQQTTRGQMNQRWQTEQALSKRQLCRSMAVNFARS